MTKKETAIAFIAMVAAVISIFGLVPLWLIWAINTLVPAANIPITFWTWLAALSVFLIINISPNINK